jgi:c-di-GMP-binding flagellar brake protein YcgR
MQNSPRKLRRHHLIFYLRVHDVDTGDQLGFLGDITTQGMMVMSKEPIETDRLFELEICNQADLEDPQAVRCKACSVWCQTDVNPDYYATGFRFEALPSEAEQAIRALIREIGFDQ